MTGLRLLLLLACFLALAAGAAGEPAIEASVSSRLVATAPVLPGARVTYEVEVLSNALSFEGLRVVPPAVTGGLLLSDAASTLKGTRRVDSKSLQYVRYRFPVFPQRPGILRIAPATVTFTASPGYGTPGRRFRLATAAQALTVAALPTAVPLAAGGLTADLALEPAGEALRVGDARTLTITRRLDNGPALLLDPIALPSMPGVAVYPGTPDVLDESSRGRLTGVRRDRFTLVFETPGTAHLPAFRFPWWDLAEGTARATTVPALRFEIAGPMTREADDGAGGRRFAAALLLTAGLAAALFFARRRSGAADGPRQRLAALRRAARRNDPRAAHAAFLRWWTGAGAVPVGSLAAALRELEEALIADSSWNGRALSRALRTHRRQARRRAAALVALNPGD